MRFLSRIPMSEAKRLGTMTPRQRKHFADTINGEHPEQPWGRADVGPARPPKMERTCALCGAGPGEPCLVTRRSHPWSPLSITTRPKQEPHGER